MSEVTLFHAPQTRSSASLALLYELDAPFKLDVLNMKAGEQRQAAFLAINPMGKVPALRDGDAIVTEQGAIFLYLADRFPENGLAPAIGDPLRGPYLRWMVYYGSSFEPAAIDKAMKREPGHPAMSPYGDYDTVMKTVNDQLKRGPYLLGDRLSAADILWGMALNWMTMFGLVENTPAVEAYVGRITARPSFRKVAKDDAALVAAHEAATKP